MTTTGPRSAGTGAVDASAGTVAWTTASGVTASDDSRARAVLTAGATSQYLVATNFGFTIGTDQEIVGIKFEVERSGSAAGVVTATEIFAVKGGVFLGGRNYATGVLWPAVDAYEAFGSAASLWGKTWTPADINAATFGLAIRTINNDVVNRNALVDHVRCTVYHRTTGKGPAAIRESFSAGAGEFTTVNGTWDYTAGNAKCTDPAGDVEPEGLAVAGLTNADKTYDGNLSSYAQAVVNVVNIGAGLYLLAGGTIKDPGLAVTMQPGEGYRIKDWDPDTSAFVTLGTFIVDPGCASGDTIRVEIVNGTLSLYRNGILRGSVTSSRLLRIGKHGVRVPHDSEGSSLDDFAAGRLNAASGTGAAPVTDPAEPAAGAVNDRLYRAPVFRTGVKLAGVLRASGTIVTMPDPLAPDDLADADALAALNMVAIPLGPGDSLRLYFGITDGGLTPAVAPTLNIGFLEAVTDGEGLVLGYVCRPFLSAAVSPATGDPPIYLDDEAAEAMGFEAAVEGESIRWVESFGGALSPVTNPDTMIAAYQPAVDNGIGSIDVKALGATHILVRFTDTSAPTAGFAVFYRRLKGDDARPV
jgi:hypothetical protein